MVGSDASSGSDSRAGSLATPRGWRRTHLRRVEREGRKLPNLTQAGRADYKRVVKGRSRKRPR